MQLLSICYASTNKSLLEDENNILKFTSNIGYIFKEKDAYNNLKLKRGFIKILEKDNENYLLKFRTLLFLTRLQMLVLFV